MTYLEQIKNVANLVADCELTKLRLEEELLVVLARKQGISLDHKRVICERIKDINKKQIELLGG